MYDSFVRIYGYDDGRCPACESTKELLERYNISYSYIPVGTQEHPCPHRKWLLKQGLTTVPQIFMDDTYIGGYVQVKQHLEHSEDD